MEIVSLSDVWWTGQRETSPVEVLLYAGKIVTKTKIYVVDFLLIQQATQHLLSWLPALDSKNIVQMYGSIEA